MSVIDKILSLALIGDLTDSPWWTDTVFRALEQDVSNDQVYDTEDSGSADSLTSEA